jgi:hypothetical protein
MTDLPAGGLSAALQQIRDLCHQRPITLNDVVQRSRARGIAILMVLCSGPFLVPVNIPGLSTPFGLLLIFCGALTALGRPVLLPRCIGRRVLSAPAVLKATQLLQRLTHTLRRFLRPRLEYLSGNTRLVRLHGLYVLVMAAILAIPFPSIPFVGSNAVAAWPIFLLGLGLIERDGVWILASYLWLLPFVLYWGFFYVALVELWQAIWPYLGGYFGG